MGKLICEICGGNTLLKEGPHFRCADCGACYPAEQMKKMLDAQTAEKESTDLPQNANEPIKISKGEKLEASQKKALSMKKVKKYVPIILAVLILLVLVTGIFALILSQAGILPRTADAKRNMDRN